MADGVEGSAVAFSWFLVEHRSMLDCPENSRPPPISLSHRGVIPTESAVADGVEDLHYRFGWNTVPCSTAVAVYSLQRISFHLSRGSRPRCRVVALTRPDSSWRPHVEQRRCAGRRASASRSRASRRARPSGKTVIQRVRASCSSHRRRTQQAASGAAKRTAV